MRCPRCQAVSVGAFPAEAPSRAQYGPRLRALAVYLVEQQFVPYGRVREVLADLFGASLSVGTLVSWVQQSAVVLAPVQARLKAALQRALSAAQRRDGCASEWATGLGACGQPEPAEAVRGVCQARPRDRAIGILPDFAGVSVHDGWQPYRHYTQCRHALCNIHHLRELTFVEEQYQQSCAKELKDVLRAMKAAVAQAAALVRVTSSHAAREAFVSRYRALLAAGHAANPPPQRRPRQRGRVKQTPAQNLLERLWRGQGARHTH